MAIQALQGMPITVVVLVILAFMHSVEGVQVIAGTPSTFTAIQSQQTLAVALHDSVSKMNVPGGIIVHPGSRASPMMREDGSQWTCYIPPKQTPHAEEKQLTTPPLDHISEVKSPFELLERLSTLCLYRQEGLWTYEMCYKKHARQFRQGAGDVKGEDFSCGQYTGDEHQVEEIKVDTASPADARLRYVSHNMTGGAPCALSGSGRTTEVRFTCQKGVKDNVIVSVREFPTCNYIFTVSTPFLCKHPQFKPPGEIHRTINCFLAPGQRGHMHRHTAHASDMHPEHAEAHEEGISGEQAHAEQSEPGQEEQTAQDEREQPAQPHQQAHQQEQTHAPVDGGLEGSVPDTTTEPVPVPDVSVTDTLNHDEEAMQRARERAHAYALELMAADQHAVVDHAVEEEPMPQEESVLSISTDCDVREEGDVAHTPPECRITGVTPEQARIIQDQVAAGTHTDNQPAAYHAMYSRAREEAYDQVLEQGRQTGMSDARARAHARQQAAVHAHATALAHIRALDTLVEQEGGRLSDLSQQHEQQWEPEQVQQPAQAVHQEQWQQPEQMQQEQSQQQEQEPLRQQQEQLQQQEQSQQQEQEPLRQQQEQSQQQEQEPLRQQQEQLQQQEQEQLRQQQEQEQLQQQQEQLQQQEQPRQQQEQLQQQEQFQQQEQEQLRQQQEQLQQQEQFQQQEHFQQQEQEQLRQQQEQFQQEQLQQQQEQPEEPRQEQQTEHLHPTQQLQQSQQPGQPEKPEMTQSVEEDGRSEEDAGLQGVAENEMDNQNMGQQHDEL